LLVFGFQAISDITVIVRLKGNILILNGLFIDLEFLEYVFFNTRIDRSGFSFTSILNGKVFGISTILFK